MAASSSDPALTSNERGEIVWSPSPDAWSSSRLAAFAAHAAGAGSPSCTDLPELLEWSLADLSDFWGRFAEWAGVRWHDRPTGVLGRVAMPGTAWFPGGTLNHAEQALLGPAHPDLPWRGADATVVVSLSQSRDRVELTRGELLDQVARCRSGLQRLGVVRGDRVAALLPNIAETIVAFLATASLGAVWTSCAPEFGVRAVVDRWSQLEPRVVLTVDGYRYGARHIERCDEVAEVVAALPSVEHVVVLPYLDSEPSIDVDRPMLSWTELLADTAPLEFVAVPFDHPLYVLFSSGTTGLPKPIVHGHGGITVEHLKVLMLHHDLRPGDRFMWFTTTGWMMWNYLVSGLLVDATVVLFDGDPGSPDLTTLWRIADDERIDVFGVSAPFVMACRKAGLAPGADLDLSHLRQLGSTGAPLPADGFRWVRDHVGAHVQTCSVSGGTDVCTAFVGGSPTLAVRAGEITGRLLGCDVQAVDPDGVRCPDGVTGELVIASPMPSMPTGLWGDASGDRYRGTYFEQYPGRWHHGDWITFRADGSCEITGRSDATLNRGGVRLGTSDFYAVVESMPEVADSLVVHLEDGDGGPGTLILLVAPATGAPAARADARADAPVVVDEALRRSIALRLRTELSPRHVPDVIDQVRAIPRTLSGKKLEVPVKRLLQGHPPERVAARGSLADPTALDDVVAWAATWTAARAAGRAEG